nr:MAG TPA: hypothetical protein [Caudoviricetes sp.]
MTRTELIQVATFTIKERKLYAYLISHPLYHCNARILQSNRSKWVLLQSYNTIVAAYDKNIDVLFVFDYYSHTTCQHVAKFQHWLKYEFCPVSVKCVNLYNDSRTGKRAAKKNLEDDFTSVIAATLKQH